MPWGMAFDDAALRLRSCARGSIAAEHALLMDCIGMQVESINGSCVLSQQDVISLSHESAVEIQIP